MLRAVDNVIWAALIAVAGSGITGGIAAWASTGVARGQQAVEMQKVQAERDRLLAENGEDDRRQRRTVYRDYLALLNRLDMYSSGWPPDVEFADLLHQLNDLNAAVDLLGSAGTRTASNAFTIEMARIADHMLGRSEPTVWGRWVPAYQEHRPELLTTMLALSGEMRRDIAHAREPLTDAR
jgi:hypothetical protein